MFVGDDNANYIVDIIQEPSSDQPNIKFSFALFKKLAAWNYQLCYSTPYFSYSGAQGATGYNKSINCASVISDVNTTKAGQSSATLKGI